MTMTDEQMRIAIAEACGIQTRMFRFLIPYHDGQEIYRSHYKTREAAEEDHQKQSEWVLSSVEEYIELLHVPDYLVDLNAMHEAEKVLTEGQRRTYFFHLFGTQRLDDADLWRAVHATARQRAIAFIKTLNLEPK